MSSEQKGRLNSLRHSRQQKVVEALIAKSAEASDCRLAPINAEVSLEWQKQISREVVRAREDDQVRRSKYGSIEEALAALRTEGDHSNELEGMFEFYLSDGSKSGFFSGVAQLSCLARLLEKEFEGLLALHEGTGRRSLVDVVVDDSVDGSFVEVETWRAQEPEG